MATFIWILTLAFLSVGTWLTLRRLKPSPRPLAHHPEEGVSILKPLKGADPGLEENLESFFLLDHPRYELLFSVAEAEDPAVQVVAKLRSKYPQVRSRLLIGAEDAGLNPKVNNLVRSYRLANHDVILISDSNVRVAPDYLRRKLSHLKSGVGVVTAVVAGVAPRGLGGALEATYLNTFYARGMNLAFATGNPCVIGKSMLFRRSIAIQFGGIKALGEYLAEDYALGEAMRQLGYRVELMTEAIDQFIGDYSFSTFWQRHVRWGRIRKAHAPIAFLVEPCFSPIVSSAWAGWALSGQIPFAAAFALNLGAWLVCDQMLMRRFAKRAYSWAPLAWLLREFLSLPLWVAVASGSSVQWRGRTLHMQHGGKIKVEGAECQPSHSYGELLPARTKLKDKIGTAIGGSGRPKVILREG